MKQKHDYHHGDMAGSIAAKFANHQTLNDFCLDHIPNYNAVRFRAIAIRVLLGKETVITIYAVDKLQQKDTVLNTEKIPVKKFKLNTLPVSVLFSYCESFNFTLSDNNYPIDNMEIINK